MNSEGTLILTCSEQVTCENVLEPSGNVSLGCLCEGTLGVVFPESPGDAMEGMNSPALLVCLERQASKRRWTLALSCQKTDSAIPGSHLMTESEVHCPEQHREKKLTNIQAVCLQSIPTVL